MEEARAQISLARVDFKWITRVMHCRQVQVQIDTHKNTAVMKLLLLRKPEPASCWNPHHHWSWWAWRAFSIWEDSDSRPILSEFGNTVFKSVRHWPNSAPPVTAEEAVITKAELQQSQMVLKMRLHLFCKGTALPSGTTKAIAKLSEQFWSWELVPSESRNKI